MNDDDVKQPKPEEALVLVGFGKYRLIDMLTWMDTDKEEDLARAFVKWPPVYRREEICSQTEIEAACRYLAFIQDLILEYELQTNPEGEK